MNENANPLVFGKKRLAVVRRSGVGTGTTSLLMIFTVLCFATLAMLSLSTAASNQRIQQRGVAGGTAIAAAKGDAAGQLAALDEELALLWQQENENWQAAQASAAPIAYSATADTYQKQAANAAVALGWVKSGEEEGVFSLTTPAGEETILVTTVRILPLARQAGPRYELVGQQSGPAGGWQPEAGAGLWMP